MAGYLKQSGAVIYRGPSLYDPNTEIMVVLTGLDTRSGNDKTGDMVQSWIIPVDVKPSEAARTGVDAAVCGTCPMRPLLADGGPVCYVRKDEAPRSVWGKATRDVTERDVLATALSGGYVDATEPWSVGWLWAVDMVRGRMLRLGSWGDPAATPRHVWDAFLRVASGRTGYTHGWLRPRVQRDWVGVLQASADNEALRALAESRGWGTFLVVPKGADAPRGAIRCPASKEAGKVATCETCGMCDGSGKQIVIDVH